MTSQLYFKGDSMRWTIFLFLAFATISSPVFAKGECQELKAKIQAKKGSCKSLPKEQRTSCKEEIKNLKEEHSQCKENAKAQKIKK